MTQRPILLDLPAELVGDRVIVRPFRDEEAPTLFEAIRESVEHLRPWMPWVDSHQSVDDTLEYIRQSGARYRTREDLPMGFFLQAGGRVLGGSGLHVRSWEVPAFEIGYWIRKSEEGRGYVTEAAQLLTQFGFQRLGAQRIMIRCDLRNRRSATIPERLGYVKEGVLRHLERDTSGNPANFVVYSMIPDDYRRR